MPNGRNKLCGFILTCFITLICSVSFADAADVVTTVPAPGGQNAAMIYTLDQHGLLNMVIYGNAAPGTLQGGVPMRAGPWNNEANICTLNAALRCDPNLPMLNQQGGAIPAAYNINETGVNDGQRLFPWADPTKASRFLALIRQNLASGAVNSPPLTMVCEAQFLGLAPRNLAQCKSSFDAICTSRQGVQQVAIDNSAMGVRPENVINICMSMGYR